MKSFEGQATNPLHNPKGIPISNEVMTLFSKTSENLIKDIK